MKILHFSPSSYSDDLGTGRRLSQLLRDDGNDHYFLVPGGEDREDSPAWQKQGNLFHRRCRYLFRLRFEVPVLSRYLKIALNSRSLVRAAPPPGEFDLVIAHNPLDFAFPALGYARRHRLPLVYEIHTLYYDEVAVRRRKRVPGFFFSLAKRIALIGEKRVIRSTGAVIVQTEALRKRVADLYRADPEKIVVVPNGIDVELFRPPDEAEREQGRREKGWGGKAVILYSGYLDWINGVDFLLEAASALPPGLKERSLLVIAGDGPLADIVHRRVGAEPDFIQYLGRLDHRRMPRLYGLADIFVIPRPATEAGDSLVPIKLLEAMAMEKVILASDLAAFREVIGDDRCGLLFRRGDAGDFREKLAALIERFDDYVPLGSRARAEALARFDWNHSRKFLRELYRKIAGEE